MTSTLILEKKRNLPEQSSVGGIESLYDTFNTIYMEVFTLPHLIRTDSMRTALGPSFGGCSA
jgi:hypothetical protein